VPPATQVAVHSLRTSGKHNSALDWNTADEAVPGPQPSGHTQPEDCTVAASSRYSRLNLRHQTAIYVQCKCAAQPTKQRRGARHALGWATDHTQL
jgi:hypothetical protein